MAKRKCNTQVFPYDDLTYCYGKPVLGGIRPAVYAIPQSELITFAKLRVEASSTPQSDMAVLKGDFIPAPSSYWRKIDIVPTKGSLTWETQGEHPARTFLNKAKFVFPGTCEEATAFARQAVHDFLIFAVQQTDGSWRILGSLEFPADVQVSGGTGEGLGGEVGINIEVTATDLCPAPFYKGHLFLEHWDCINCAYEAPYQYCRNRAWFTQDGTPKFSSKKEFFGQFKGLGEETGIEIIESDIIALFFGATAPNSPKITTREIYGSNYGFEILINFVCTKMQPKYNVTVYDDAGEQVSGGKASTVEYFSQEDNNESYNLVRYLTSSTTTDLSQIEIEGEMDNWNMLIDFAVYSINHEPTNPQ